MVKATPRSSASPASTGPVKKKAPKVKRLFELYRGGYAIPGPKTEDGTGEPRDRLITVKYPTGTPVVVESEVDLAVKYPEKFRVHTPGSGADESYLKFQRGEDEEPGSGLVDVFATPNSAILRGEDSPDTVEAEPEAKGTKSVYAQEAAARRSAQGGAEEASGAMESGGDGGEEDFEDSGDEGSESEVGDEGEYQAVQSKLGEDVTANYAKAQENGLIVLKKGQWHYIASADEPDTALNEKALHEGDVKAELRKLTR